MRKFTVLLSLLATTGCTGRQNPSHYKPGNGDSWYGNPPKTNAAAPMLPSLVAMSERMAAARTRSLVVAPPSQHTNGIIALGYTLPPDASAKGLRFYTGTTNGIFKLALTAGLYDNVTLRGLDETRTNYIYATATNLAGVESIPSGVLAVLPSTNLTGVVKPSIANHTLRITWPNTGVSALETTPRLSGNWTRLAIVNTNGIAAVVVTNNVTGFFRANTSGGRPTLNMTLWQQLISFSVPGVLQSLADANSGSWLNVATNTTGTLTVIKPVGNQWQVRL